MGRRANGQTRAKQESAGQNEIWIKQMGRPQKALVLLLALHARIERLVRFFSIQHVGDRAGRQSEQGVRECGNGGHQRDKESRGAQLVQCQIDCGVMSSNAASGDDHCEPKPSEDGISQR